MNLVCTLSPEPIGGLGGWADWVGGGGGGAQFSSENMNIVIFLLDLETFPHTWGSHNLLKAHILTVTLSFTSDHAKHDSMVKIPW